MIDPKSQPMIGTVSFIYNAPIFEGDPEDRYEVAALEHKEYVDAVLEAIEDIVGPTTSFSFSIVPE